MPSEGINTSQAFVASMSLASPSSEISVPGSQGNMEGEGLSFSSSSSSSKASTLLSPWPPAAAGYSSGNGSLGPSSSEEDRVLTALRIHSEAEKRRRERINAHLSTLRRLIPNSSKMDKASLLGRVVEQVRELKRKATDISKVCRIPREVNEVVVEMGAGRRGDDDHASTSGAGDVNMFYIKASVCCDDRPNLFTDLDEAFRRLRLRTIRSDMMSLGGRVHNVFTLCSVDGDERASSSSLMECIRDVLGRVVSSEATLPSLQAFHIKRRRRILHTHKH